MVKGTTRYFCSFEPPGNGLPLVVVFPGSGANAGWMYFGTRWRQKAETEEIKPGVTGYVMLIVQQLNRHWPRAIIGGEDGTKGDILYRDYAQNEDMMMVDQLIDGLVSSGTVDPEYIFASGWSNGCMFSQAYAISRWTQRTPGGNRVARVASYSCGTPYGAIGLDLRCRMSDANRPNPALPIRIVNGACDASPCQSVEQWRDILKTGNAESDLVLVDSSDNIVQQCVPSSSCSIAAGWLRHLKWPISQDHVFYDFFRRVNASTTMNNNGAARFSAHYFALAVTMLLLIVLV
jgi:poly(3-hydroxybutyrate) depolymerase